MEMIYLLLLRIQLLFYFEMVMCNIKTIIVIVGLFLLQENHTLLLQAVAQSFPHV